METVHRTVVQSAADPLNLESESIDLVLTSPPYPMIEMWDAVFGAQEEGIARCLECGDGPGAFELMHIILDKAWRECYRVLKPGAFACINIGDATRKVAGGFRLYTNHSRVTSYCESLGFQSLPAIVWKKQTNAPNKFMGSGMLPGAYITLEHEYVLVFRKGDKRVFSDCDRRRRQRSAFFWEERNVWFSDTWDFKGTGQSLCDNKARKRSAAFPFELAFRLINMYSMQEDIVLDPFAGTGTTVVAAIASARNSLGIEIDPRVAASIEESVQNNSDAINERQLQRLRNHGSFLEQYQEKHGRKPGYRNLPHGFPVMTRQEVNLRIPLVAKIQKTEEAQIRVFYQQNGGEVGLTVEPEGVAGGEVQLGLGLTT